MSGQVDRWMISQPLPPDLQSGGLEDSNSKSVIASDPQPALPGSSPAPAGRRRAVQRVMNWSEQRKVCAASAASHGLAGSWGSVQFISRSVFLRRSNLRSAVEIAHLHLQCGASVASGKASEARNDTSNLESLVARKLATVYNNRRM